MPLQLEDESEAGITRSIRYVLNILKIFHWKQWQGPMSKPKGVSDIIGIYKGRFLAIEVKRKGHKLTHHQQKFIDRVNAEGGIGIAAWCLDDVIDGLGVRDRFLV